MPKFDNIKPLSNLDPSGKASPMPPRFEEADAFTDLPQLTKATYAKYAAIFSKSGAINGQLDGKRTTIDY